LKSRPAFGPPPQRSSSNTVQEKLSRAVSLHQQGNLVEAGRLYAEILKGNKTHVDALQLLGLIHHQTNNSAEAERLLAKAIRLNPKVAAFHYNYGHVLHKLGRFGEAVESYNRAIALNPDYAEAYSNRGLTLHELKNFDAALKNYDRSIALKPRLNPARTRASGRGCGQLRSCDNAEARLCGSAL
jgi:protein O-GlcNAc transferase